MTKARDLANAGTALTSVSATELGYVDGVTSAIQTQLNNKQAVVSGVDDTEIGYLNGVTSAIQTQLDGKIAKSLVDAAGDLIYGSANDTVTRLGIGTAGQYLKVNSGATAPEWATLSAGGMTELATGSLSGSSVTISSISGSYVDLALYLYGHSSSGGTDNAVRFNGVTSNSYQFNYIDTGGSSVFQSGAVSRMYCNPGSASSGICFAKVEIFNYASTSNWKNVRFIGMRNGLGWNGGGIFESGNAITSIEIGFNGTATFASGTYKLYGVK